MKLFPVFLLFIFLSTYCAAQKQNVYFFKDNGDKVSTKDYADFIRIIQEPDSGSTNFKVLEFYTNETKKFIGSASAFESRLILEGPCINFDKEGKKADQIAYVNGIPTGTAFYFHNNGKLKKTLEYGKEGMTEFLTYKDSIKYKLIDFFDFEGIQTVKGGIGYVKEIKDSVAEEGKYLEGVKDELWKGVYQNRNLSFEEIYKNGVLISGTSTTSDSSHIEYRQIKTLPEFPGGMKQYVAFLIKNLKYPPEAQENNLSGRVSLSFIVETDGTLVNMKVLKKVYPSLDKEALRVLQKSPKWQPGKERGLPVRSNYTLPMVFQLSSR